MITREEYEECIQDSCIKLNSLLDEVIKELNVLESGPL